MGRQLLAFYFIIFLHIIVRAQTPPQVVYLNAVSLNEEQTYENYLVYNFNEHLTPSSTFRLEILASSSSSNNNNNNNNPTILSSQQQTTTIASKFRLVDSTRLQLSGSFDRESLIERAECAELLLQFDSADPSDLPFSPAASAGSSESPYASLSTCTLNLKIALYNSDSTLVKLFVLPVRVLDVNDQRPRFPSNIYHVNVSENLAAPRTTLPLDMPVDLDSEKFSIRDCQLLPSATNNNNSNSSTYVAGEYHQFDVVLANRASALSLVINGALDRENTSIYSFALICSDGRFKSRAQLVLHVLDANDNLPVVRTPKMNITVSENDPIPPSNTNSQQPNQQQQRRRLIRVDAYDLDDPNSPNGQLVFSLPAELNTAESRRVFEIEPSTGWIGLREALDYEKAKRHVLKVRVEDQGANSVPVYAEVLVTVVDTNDNAPTCELTYADASSSIVVASNRTNRTIWIREETEASASSPLTLAYLTLTDPDSPLANGHALSASLLAVRYLNATSLHIHTETLHTSNNSSTFRLTPIIAHYGNYYYALQLTRRLDRESTVHFDLTIRLSDNAAAAGSDVAMTSYVDVRVILVDLNDNYPEFRANTHVLNDAGVSQFEYFKFSLPENTLSLDFGRVQAFDPDRVASARLEYTILDEMSHTLVDLYAQHVAKSDPIAQAALSAMNTLTGVGIDSQNNDEQLLASQSNPNYLFFINAENGTLGVRGELDRERREVYLFTVRVNDSEHASDVLVEVRLVDVNDNQPVYQLERVEFALEENRGENSVVGNVKPNDPDERPVTEYFIEPAVMAKYFYVEPLSGNLVAKTSLDAEDKSLAPFLTTPNHTFEMTIYARDPHFFTKQPNNSNSSLTTPAMGVYLRQMSKLDVSVRLVDVNDNKPRVRSPDESSSLISFDLSRYANETSSCHNMNLVLKSIETVDDDRDVADKQQQPHYYKFAFIRRLSWPFVYEILKSSPTIAATNSSSNNTSSNRSLLHTDLLGFVDAVVRVQTKYDIRPVSKVNLRSVFLMDQRADRRVLNQVNVTLNQLCKLNWGVYNLSVLIGEDQAMTTPSAMSDYSLKMFVYNSIYEIDTALAINLTRAHLQLLDSTIETWWAANSHLIVGVKRAPAASSSVNSTKINSGNSSNSDDNGDYIDGITQEYFKFYASTAFSRFGHYHRTGGSSLSNNPFWDLTNLVVFTSASHSIVLLIVAFLVVSLALVVFISYKQYRASRGRGSSAKPKEDSTKKSKKNNGNGGGHSPGSKKSSSGAFLNVMNGSHHQRDKLDCTSSSTSSSDMGTASSSSSSTQQSTRDLTGSPNLAPAKISVKKISTISSSKTSSSSASSSMSASSTNLILYPGQQQQQQHLKIKQRENNSSNNNNKNGVGISSGVIASSSGPTNTLNPSNEQVSRYVKCGGLAEQAANNTSSSICDSFTVITSLTTAPATTTTSGSPSDYYHQNHQYQSQQQQSQQPQANITAATSVYISATPILGATTVTPAAAAAATTTTTTVLSTFSPVATTQATAAATALSSSSSSSSSSPDTSVILLKHNHLNHHQSNSPRSTTLDQGYYGSSDYSDVNNSFGTTGQRGMPVFLRPKSTTTSTAAANRMSASSTNNGVVIVNTKSGVPLHTHRIIYNHQNRQPPAAAAAAAATTTTTTTTHSSSSFASSSLMSSPSSSTDSYTSSDFVQQQQNAKTTTPTVTNLYPGGVYGGANGGANYANLMSTSTTTTTLTTNKSSSSSSSSSSNPSECESSNDVTKIYLEKFERIYNSENASTVVAIIDKQQQSTSNPQPQPQQQLNTFSNFNKRGEHRNSMTTYSYV